MVNLQKWIEKNKNYSDTLGTLEHLINDDEDFISYRLWEQIPGTTSFKKAEYLFEVWKKNKTIYELW